VGPQGASPEPEAGVLGSAVLEHLPVDLVDTAGDRLSSPEASHDDVFVRGATVEPRRLGVRSGRHRRTRMFPRCGWDHAQSSAGTCERISAHRPSGDLQGEVEHSRGNEGLSSRLGCHDLKGIDAVRPVISILMPRAAWICSIPVIP
jgi:hypothetical protein